MSRSTFLSKLRDVAPHLLPFVRMLYGQPSVYSWWDDRGRPREIQQGEGCEQGDALALTLYAFSILPTGRASDVGDGGGVKPEVATSSCVGAASPWAPGWRRKQRDGALACLLHGRNGWHCVRPRCVCGGGVFFFFLAPFCNCDQRGSRSLCQLQSTAVGRLRTGREAAGLRSLLPASICKELVQSWRRFFFPTRLFTTAKKGFRRQLHGLRQQERARPGRRPLPGLVVASGGVARGEAGGDARVVALRVSDDISVSVVPGCSGTSRRTAKARKALSRCGRASSWGVEVSPRRRWPSLLLLRGPCPSPHRLGRRSLPLPL